MKSQYIFLIFISLLFSCGQQPTDEEIEKAFQQVNNETLWKELEEMVYNDQYYRSQKSGLDKDALDYQKKRDSLENIRIKNDHKNTRRIIEITEKYGFPDPDRTGKPISAWVLLHHAPTEYHEEIKPLIEREYQAKRMDSMTYVMLKWHVNGRQGLP
ncbi:hypothetical protein [Aquimarina sp. SS2-1]|uniref:hypothetical protein n=1 Tax=Aquimarina besae TaxID=3342247 RepID=UPI003670BFE9